MRRLFLFVALVTAGMPLVTTQTASGVITGTVRVQTGAVVVNASLTQIHEATGARRTAVSNDTGAHTFFPVQPGS